MLIRSSCLLEVDFKLLQEAQTRVHAAEVF
jgi:hypothetical protein